MERPTPRQAVQQASDETISSRNASRRWCHLAITSTSGPSAFPSQQQSYSITLQTNRRETSSEIQILDILPLAVQQKISQTTQEQEPHACASPACPATSSRRVSISSGSFRPIVRLRSQDRRTAGAFLPFRRTRLCITRTFCDHLSLSPGISNALYHVCASTARTGASQWCDTSADAAAVVVVVSGCGTFARGTLAVRAFQLYECVCRIGWFAFC